MTRSQKAVIKKLLTGHFLRKVKRRLAEWYVLYDEKVNPLQRIRARTIERIDRYINPEWKLWKRNKLGNISLNLSTVARLHGNHTIKRLYKQKHKLEANDPIYKKRSKHKLKSIESSQQFDITW